MDDDVSPWPPISKDNILFQAIDEPKVYRMENLSEDDVDMVEFFDKIDIDTR